MVNMHGAKLVWWWMSELLCQPGSLVFLLKSNKSTMYRITSIIPLLTIEAIESICIYIYIYIHTSSARTRRGGSCLKDIQKTFLIYRTCLRRAPAKPVRACTLRNWCLVSHVTFEAPLRTSHFSLQSSHSTLHTSHSTLHTALLRLHTSHFTLRTSHSTLHTSHCTLRTPNFTLHSPHFTLHSPHFTLLTPHCFLHTPNFTLHTSHCTLHAPHFISSEPFSPYPSSSLLISFHMSFKLSWITSQYYY